ncbi:MAG TPA: hypothetical protein H9900_05315 [Candidatus Monoglobus merdigallinarum]|uniref:Uncharacterized protein n=1 Tax=Candidatus Monoglobus merdigallinarum TaxID=2838698 RepID=A0A9D1PRR2_9FIRM|nr:hypothetical protein [Candidatus Monoglobus merdigallinarum]
MRRLISGFIVISVLVMSVILPVQGFAAGYDGAAVVAGEGVYIKSASSSITGDVYLNGDVEYGNNADSSQISGTVVQGSGFNCTYPGFTVPEIGNVINSAEATVKKPLTISQDTRISNLKVDAGGKNKSEDPAIVIDTAAGDVVLVVDKLNDFPSILVEGSNTAYIYFTDANHTVLDNMKINSYADGTPRISGSPSNTKVFISGDDDYDFSNVQVYADVYFDTNGLELEKKTVITGNIYTNADKIEITSPITGVICAPESECEVNSSGVVRGQVHVKQLNMANGNGVIIYDASIAESGEPALPSEPTVEPSEPTTEPSEPTEQPSEPAGKVVRYNVATGEYSRGTMATKMHTPDGVENAHLNYEVLDENTFEVSGPQEVSDDIKADVQLILETVNDTFISRKADPAVNLQWWRFGRIDSNGTSMTLSITPYSYQTIQAGGVDTMWLCWGDRDTEVETVWMVVE